MPSSGIWRRVDLVWTDVSEERIASIFRVELTNRLLITLYQLQISYHMTVFVKVKSAVKEHETGEEE
jgi:hypothetical protein